MALPVIDARAGLSQHAGNVRILQTVDRVLAARAAAEVLARDHNIAGLDLFGKVLLAGVIFKRVLRHILRIGLGEILVVVNEVGIDIVARRPTRAHG